MPAVCITSLSYVGGDTNLLVLNCDFSPLGISDGPEAIVLHPEAIGNRIAVHGYTDGEQAFDAIVVEHATRIAPDVTGVTVDWQSPSDEQKASQLDALADAIEAARVFFTPENP